MSIRLMNAVWSMELDSGSKFVLLSLADQANDEGEAFPSISTIAKRTSKTERSVYQIIGKLRDRGLIEVISGKIGRSNRYRITPEIISPLKLFQDEKNDTQPLKSFQTNHKKNHQSISIKGKQPDRAEAQTYATEIGLTEWEAWWDYYTVNGWKTGRNPVKDWKATMRNWLRNQRKWETPKRAENNEQQEGIEAKSL